MKGLKNITRLDKNVNPVNLIHRYKGSTAADVKFNEFDNALNFLDKIKERKIGLADAKKMIRLDLNQVQVIKKKKQRKQTKRVKKHTIQC